MSAVVNVYQPALAPGAEPEDDSYLQWWASIETPDGSHEVRAWSHPELVALIDDWASKRGLRIPNHTIELEPRP